MIVKVCFFASAKSAVGTSRLELTLNDDAILGDVKSLLLEQYPALNPMLPHCAFAVDQEYADDNKALYHGCEIGCIPPVSGG